MATKKKAAKPVEKASAEKAPVEKAPAAKKAPAVKAAKKAAAKAPVTKAAKNGISKPSAAPSTDAIAQAAYLIYRRRVELGLPGDSQSDWAEAERNLARSL